MRRPRRSQVGCVVFAVLASTVWAGLFLRGARYGAAPLVPRAGPPLPFYTPPYVCSRTLESFPLPNSSVSIDSSARPRAPVDLCVAVLKDAAGPWDAVTEQTARRVFVTYGDKHYTKAKQILCRGARLLAYFDSVHCTGPEDLPVEWASRNAALLRLTRGAGYFAWKPQVILSALADMGWGDVLLFADAGSTWVGSPARLIASALESGGALAFKQAQSATVGKWTKMDSIVAVLGVDFDRAVLSKTSVYGGFLVIQKRPWTVALIEEWAWWTQWPGLVDDSPSLLPNEPEFTQHRHDQSLWSLLVIKHSVNSTFEQFRQGATVLSASRVADSKLFRQAARKRSAEEAKALWGVDLNLRGVSVEKKGTERGKKTASLRQIT